MNKAGTDKVHKWTAFVRTKDQRIKVKKLIKNVSFELHESYKGENPVVVETKKPRYGQKHCKISKTNEIRCTKTAYGWFLIPITITFLENFQKQPISVEHRLNFYGKETYKTYKFQFGQEIVNELIPGFDKMMAPQKLI